MIRFEIAVYLILAAVFSISGLTADQPVLLKGEYFGQPSPGTAPRLFAPGIVSTGANELNICFSPSGDEMFYFVSGPAFQPRVILSSRLEKSSWTRPMELPFFDKDRTDSYPFMAPDGEKLFFNSSRPYAGKADSGEHPLHEIWYVERSGDTWGNPRKIDFGPGTPRHCTFPTVASSGNIYFNAAIERDVSDIYFSKYENGAYSSPVRLSDAVNSDHGDFHPYIAPDESYLMFDSQRKEESTGRQDIFISFRDGQGNWTRARNIGDTVNTGWSEMRPYVTFDGKYLFFVSNRPVPSVLPDRPMTGIEAGQAVHSPGNGLQDIYWVGADFLQKLKPSR